MTLPVFDDAMIDFMRAHADMPVAALGLVKMNPYWPRAAILNQIKARQKLRHKNPEWAARYDLILPSPDLIEQSSSRATALFKKGLIAPAQSFVDLTAGCGADCAALAPAFKNGHAVEMDTHSADCLAHNLVALGHVHIRVHPVRAEEFIASMAPVDLAIIDPQRRDSNRRGIFRFSEMSPNIPSLWPVLKEKAAEVLIKGAPHLDIDHAIGELGDVAAIHILEWDGDCKEVILHFCAGESEARIHAHRIDDNGKSIYKIDATRAEDAASPCPIALPKAYLYEPGPAFMKAGLFRTIASKFSLEKLHPSTHLYTSDALVENFPGRVFKVIKTTAADRKFMPEHANLALRNFPGDTESLKKKLKIQDGGDDYLFACTLMDGHKVILHTKKI